LLRAVVTLTEFEHGFDDDVLEFIDIVNDRPSDNERPAVLKKPDQDQGVKVVETTDDDRNTTMWIFSTTLTP